MNLDAALDALELEARVHATAPAKDRIYYCTIEANALLEVVEMAQAWRRFQANPVGAPHE